MFVLKDTQSHAERVIDVRQCLLELYLLSKPKTLHQVLQFAFHVSIEVKNCEHSYIYYWYFSYHAGLLKTCSSKGHQ